MAFLAVGVVALGAMGSYWWWGTPVTTSTIEAPATPPVPSVASRRETTISTAEPVNLIDELKVALAARRNRHAPGTC